MCIEQARVLEVYRRLYLFSVIKNVDVIHTFYTKKNDLIKKKNHNNQKKEKISSEKSVYVRIILKDLVI